MCSGRCAESLTRWRDRLSRKEKMTGQGNMNIIILRDIWMNHGVGALEFF